MPQLDFVTFPSQIFWIIVSFGMFYLAISHMVLPKIARSLSHRHKHIEELIKKSSETKEQAGEIFREAKTLLEEISLEEKAKIEQANLKVKDAFADMHRDMEEAYLTSLTKLENDLKLSYEENIYQLKSEARSMAEDFISSCRHSKT